MCMGPGSDYSDFCAPCDPEAYIREHGSLGSMSSRPVERRKRKRVVASQDNLAHAPSKPIIAPSQLVSTPSFDLSWLMGTVVAVACTMLCIFAWRVNQLPEYISAMLFLFLALPITTLFLWSDHQHQPNISPQEFFDPELS